MAISLLLPVVSTIHPLALDTPMSSTPRRRDWRFSSVSPEGSRPSTPGQHGGEGHVRLLNGHHPQVDAEARGQDAGVVAGPFARIARGHGDPVHAGGPERIDGDRGHQRRVDPAGQPDHRLA